MEKSNWGPGNPHPFSKTKTELIWEGKYDEYGNRREIKLPSTPYPLQKIEAIDEPHDRLKADRWINDSFLDEDKFNESNHPDNFRNMLIWGDNKLILHSLLEKYRGQIDLVYIDPPFDVGADFTMDVQIGDSNDSLQKEQSILEAVAYRDTWGKGTDSYIHMIYERLNLIRELLSDKGAIYIHCDWRVDSLLRGVMNDVFGYDNFRNMVVWKKSQGARGVSAGLRNYIRLYDSIIYYSKTQDNIYNNQKMGYSEATLRMFKYEDEFGRYRLNILRNYSQETIERLDGEGKIFTDTKGKKHLKQYLTDDSGVSLPDIWTDIPPIGHTSFENCDFPTQKPEALLERIISASTNTDSIIADFFCGSGTTLAVAEKLGRKWIGADLGRFSIHTTRKRMLQVQRELHLSGKPYRSFDVYNLGRYERQWWQKEKLHGADSEHRAIVMKFYKATELVSPPSALLHGKKGGAVIHVDEIDGMFTGDELVSVVHAASMAGAKELHILAWEFEMELTLRKQAIEAEYGMQIKLVYIPREIMESNRTECQFFEAGYLKAKILKSRDGKIDVELENFIPSLAEAPEAELTALRERSVKSPFDFIDFWAVDFDYHQDKPFEHHWQDYRIKKKRSLTTKTDLGWMYHNKGNHQVCVKVIDVFGVDTTIVIPVEA